MGSPPLTIFGSDPLLQTLLLFVGITSSIILVILTILRLVGVGFDADAHDAGGADTDAGGDSGHHGISPTSFLSVQSLCAFFSMFGLVGFGMMRNGVGTLPSLGTSALCGLAAVLVIGFLMKAMSKLNESGSLQLSDIVNAEGTVYIPVPPKESGLGMVHLSIRGVSQEYQALTSAESKLPSGSKIRVAEMRGPATVLVVPA